MGTGLLVLVQGLSAASMGTGPECYNWCLVLVEIYFIVTNKKLNC